MKRLESNDLGVFAKPMGWNESTRMCYERGCNCKGCTEVNFSSEGYKCQVKAVVLESVRIFGSPFERNKVVIDD